MLKYSDRTSAIYSLFFRYRNDIDIYTEDEYKDKEFYKKLFSRMLNGSIRINDITPLGTKSNVIKQCKENFGGDRKKIFIVDGDIMLLNDTNERHENLFVLEKYCIENYLIDKEAVAEYIYSRCGIYSLEDINSKLNFGEWLAEYESVWMELFFHFAVKGLCRDLQNSQCKLGNFSLYNAHKYHRVCKQTQKYILDIDKVQLDIKELENQIIDIKGIDFYNEQIALLRGKFEISTESLLKYVSGKNYLIPILQYKTSEIRGTNDKDSLEVVKLNLVDKFNINSLEKLKNRIEEICQ